MDALWKSSGNFKNTLGRWFNKPSVCYRLTLSNFNQSHQQYKKKSAATGGASWWIKLNECSFHFWYNRCCNLLRSHHCCHTITTPVAASSSSKNAARTTVIWPHASLVEGFHSVLVCWSHEKWHNVVVTRIKKESWERNSNSPHSPTPAQLANDSAKWVWMSDHQFWGI